MCVLLELNQWKLLFFHVSQNIIFNFSQLFKIASVILRLQAIQKWMVG
jgi:hypothetical protein